MSIIYGLIGCSILIALGFLASFIWSVRSGQYEDSYTPSVRMLFEDSIQDDTEPPPEEAILSENMTNDRNSD